MKPKILFSVFLFSIFYLNSYASVKIKAVIKNAETGTEVQLFYEQNVFEFNSIVKKIDNEGAFSAEIPVITDNLLRITIGNVYVDVFVKDNASLYFTADLNDFYNTLKFENDLSAENTYNVLEAKYNILAELNSYSRYGDAIEYKQHIDSVIKLNFSLWNNYPKENLDPIFVLQTTISLKYKHVNSLWMYKIGYDPATNKYISKSIPDNYFNFLDTLKFDKDEYVSNSNFTTALMRYLFEKFDKNSRMNLPEGLSEIEKIKLSFINRYNYRKQTLKGAVLEYEVISMFRSNVKSINPEIKPFIDSIYNDFISYAKNEDYKLWLTNHLNKLSKLNSGIPTPDIELLNEKSEKVKLSDFKNKVLYVDFWATWCLPCIINMSDSKILSSKFSDNKDLVFIYVNVKDDFYKWKKHLKKNQYEGVHLYADKNTSEELYKAYNIYGIPKYVLIDKDGKIVNSAAEVPAKAEAEIAKVLSK